MFNKKKKKWFQHKPAYKREPGDPETKPEERGPRENRPFPNNQQQGKPHFNRGPGGGNRGPNGPNQPGQFNRPPAVVQKPFEPEPLPPDMIIESILPEEPLTENASPETAQLCKICEMPIRNTYTALSHKDSDGLVHFDCVLRELAKENTAKLGKSKRVYYIGAGKFAIVKEIYDKRGHFKSYEVLERIPYEAKEK